MKYFEFTRAGREWNEDACFVSDDFGFVLDGATNVSGQNFSGAESDAKWFSNEWKEYLISALHQDKDIMEILRTGVDVITKKYKKLSKNAKIIDYPSSAVSIARRRNGKIEFYVLGDSPIIVKTILGKSFLIEDSRNTINDAICKSEVELISKENNISLIEARKLHPEIVAAGRAKKNTLGYYYVLADSKKAIDFGFLFEIPEKLVSKVLIMSDGYSQVYDLVGFMTSDEMAKTINTIEDAEKVFVKLKKYQNSDPTGKKYVRFKLSDDATIVCMNFEK
jgi:hypothetical protein